VLDDSEGDLIDFGPQDHGESQTNLVHIVLEALMRILNSAHSQLEDVIGKQHPNDPDNIYRDTDHDLDAINGTWKTADGDPNARSSTEELLHTVPSHPLGKSPACLQNRPDTSSQNVMPNLPANRVPAAGSMLKTIKIPDVPNNPPESRIWNPDCNPPAINVSPQTANQHGTLQRSPEVRLPPAPGILPENVGIGLTKQPETLRSLPEDIPDAGTVPPSPLTSPITLVEGVEINTQLDRTNDRPLPLSQDTNITGAPRNPIPAGSLVSGSPVETPGSSDARELETSKQPDRVNVPPGTTTNPPNGQDSIAQGLSQSPSTFQFWLDALPEATSTTSLPQPHPRIFPKRPRVHPPPRLPPIRPRPIWIVRRRTLPPPSNPLAEVPEGTNPEAPDRQQKNVLDDSEGNLIHFGPQDHGESRINLVHIVLVVICRKH
jgi:hypothetical protein